MSTEYYGRNRQSVVDMELELSNIFLEHPSATIDEDGGAVIPADALVDVFQSLSEHYGGVEFMAPDEMDLLKALIASNPGMQVTPQDAIGFIAEKTRHSPPQSPPKVNDEELPRGRNFDRSDGYDSRSSSSDSTGTHRNQSRPPSRGPQTPQSVASPFDTSRRQRSTPLGAAPSSWAKRPPHHRRKSDAGSRSDSEQPSASPIAFGRPAGRSRAPSNPPTSPTMSSEFALASPPLGPGPRSRPPSRQQGRHHNPPDETDYDFTLHQGLSSLPMPRANDSDSDSDSDGGADMVMDRSAASSTASMMPHDRVEALQKVNADLIKKLSDTERTMQRKLAEQEAEFDDLQIKLEETRNELSAAKREEKELRIKERTNSAQISVLEAEVVKVTKQLETSKASYNSLQRQYLDQCASSEKYRNELREREEYVRSLRESASLTQIEIARFSKEHEAYEERIASMERELGVAQQAHVQLDEQKQENMLLKETIDRMRYDLDELRSSTAAAAASGGSGQSSAANTISKSLGAELLGKMGKMKGGWGGMESEDEDEDEGQEEEEEEGTPGEDGDSTEGEDVIQTIITRKKRKVTSRATKIETRTFEEVKEYSDSATQYEAHLFAVSRKMQTDPEPKILTASSSMQTEPEPIVELPPKPHTAHMEIQTEPELEPEPEVKAEEEEDVKAGPSNAVVVPTDAPPAYKQVLSPEEQEEHDWRVTVATLKKYHPGARVEEGVPGGVSLDALEDWRALKEELGVSCLVVDKILANSPSTGLPRAASDVHGNERRRSGRFYNIYNTYVYGTGSKAAPHSNANPLPAIPPAVLWVGGTMLVFFLLGPSVMIPYYNVPGGPTYHDRALWSSFNSMHYGGEGFTAGRNEGTEAVWSFLGRVGGGAARMVRGWPT
ncbi:hypothetical protein FB45DRAFT_842656 [Roridomyces roridus]|uniref:Uncharacterized protein n=1 Tax=Roridomyces roridus TaxID=1738132 RepID=A0AAD7B9B7_9AGAR|nr:hypothetical protein FB45DRAFT_842656 [Roridomyces roridus]